ncbi:MAG TPA: hypothetical protein VFA95_03530 [Gammaproteobacteria bacterium]|nr:hypothetical protein [Gammaproteobacteria bacterium]
MSRHQSLEQAETRWDTEMGEWVPGVRVHFRDFDLHRDLLRASWVDVYMYGISGRRYSERELRMITAMWVATSFPEPRIWNNRVASLAGTARTTGNLGISAAMAVSEASIFGRRPDIRTIDFLQRARARREQGEALEEIVRDELKRYRGLPGYGRPVTNVDERIPHVMAVARGLGFDDGPFVRLAQEIEEVLQRGRWRMKMNYACLAAALSADMGMSPREYYAGTYPAFLAGMWPCFIEASQKEEGTFFPLRCARIAYEGPGPRRWE